MTRIRIGEFVVDPDSNAVVCPDGGEVRLEPKVMAVLCALAERPGEVVTREWLIDRIWGVEHGADERLTRAVSILRKVFNGAPEERPYIVTIPKRGYKLVAPLSGMGAPSREVPGPDIPADGKAEQSAPLDAEAQGPAARRQDSGHGTPSHSTADETAGALPHDGSSISAATASGSSRLSARTARLALSRTGLLAGFAAGTVIVLIAAFLLIGGGPSGSSGGVTRNLLAVKPLQVISKKRDDAELRAFADSLRTNIATYLSTYNVNVVTPDERAAQNNPEFELEGTVEREGDKLGVNAQLYFTGERVLLWSRRYTRASDEAAGFRDQIAANITLVVGRALAFRKNDDNMSKETFRAWLRFLEVARSVREMEETLSNLINYSERLLQSAPDNPNAMATHAFILMTDHNSSGESGPKERARELAKQTLKMDPDNQVARTVLAGTMPWAGNWAKVERELEKALSHLEPGGTGRFEMTVGYYGVLLKLLGRIKDARDHYETALVTNRLMFLQPMAFARLLALAYGQIDRAEKQLAHVMRLWPNVSLPHFSRFRIHLYAGDPAVALAYLENEISGPFQFSPEQRNCYAAFARARMSASKDIRSVASACRRANAEPHFMLRGFEMLMFAYLGDLDRAYAAAEEFEHRGFWSDVFVHRSMRPFRRDPRFWPLAHKWGLVDYWLETDNWPDFCKAKDLPFDCQERALAVRESRMETAEQ